MNNQQAARRELCERMVSKMRAGKPEAELNVLGLLRGTEHYWFIYTDEQRAEAMSQIGHFAGRLDLNFNWYDCALLCQKIRRDAREASNVRGMR